MDGRTFRTMFWSLALIGATVDLATKYGIFAHLYNDGQGGAIEIIPDTFQLVAAFSNETDDGTSFLSPLRTWGGEVQPVVNKGALWGVGQGSNAIFGLISIGAAILIIGWSFRASMATDRVMCFALGLILAGTIGNLFDRVVFGGVRDFLRWYRFYEWPVFNVADVCLVCGACTLLLQAFLMPATVESREPAIEQSAPTV